MTTTSSPAEQPAEQPARIHRGKGNGHRWLALPGRPGERSKRCAICRMTRTAFAGRVVWTREAVVNGALRTPVLLVDPIHPGRYPRCDARPLDPAIVRAPRGA